MTYTTPSSNALSLCDLESYAISSTTAFVPASPLEPLPSPYAAWEHLATSIPQCIADGTIHAKITALPLLEAVSLQSEPQLRRAYLILTFLAQAYIHGGGTHVSQKKISVPASISVPLMQISARPEVGLPPVTAYASLCLWNVSKMPEEGRIMADDFGAQDLKSVLSFTGTKDEEWFYMTSVAVELVGIPILKACLNAVDVLGQLDAKEIKKASIVQESLIVIKKALERMTRILADMNKRCSPNIFYHKIRPMIGGNPAAELGDLVNYPMKDTAGGETKDNRLDLAGGSAAQSSPLQVVNITLGVPIRREAIELRGYMPGPHRRFLECLEHRINEQGSIRNFVLLQESLGKDEMGERYNEALQALKDFRNSHMRIVTQFIVVPGAKAKKAEDLNHLDKFDPRNGYPGLNNWHVLKLGSAVDKMDEEPKGTGGTSPMPFLKGMRDLTVMSMLRKDS